MPTLDFDVIDFADMITISASIQPINERKSTVVRGLETRNFYNMVFQKKWIIPDAMKKLSDNYVFVVQRKLIEAILIPSSVPKKILNFQLYDNDGTTPFTTFDFDENFLIKCTDGTVFIWYQNQLNATVFGDVWDGTTYTIEQCFQIWDIQSIAAAERWNATDAPLLGSVRFNNLDNEVRLR